MTTTLLRAAFVYLILFEIFPPPPLPLPHPLLNPQPPYELRLPAIPLKSHPSSASIELMASQPITSSARYRR